MEDAKLYGVIQDLSEMTDVSISRDNGLIRITIDPGNPGAYVDLHADQVEGHLIPWLQQAAKDSRAWHKRQGHCPHNDHQAADCHSNGLVHFTVDERCFCGTVFHYDEDPAGQPIKVCAKGHAYWVSREEATHGPAGPLAHCSLCNGPGVVVVHGTDGKTRWACSVGHRDQLLKFVSEKDLRPCAACGHGWADHRSGDNVGCASEIVRVGATGEIRKPPVQCWCRGYRCC